MNRSKAQQDVTLQGEGTVVKVNFPFRYDESVQSLENKIKALHRSISSTRKDDKQVLTIITPQPGPCLVRRTESLCSLRRTLSVDSDTAESSQSSRRRRILASDDRQWGYFADVSLSTTKRQRHGHFVKREMQLALAADMTRSLLQRQQMIHML